MSTAANSVMYRLRWPDGREFGPAPIAVLQDWARQGRVPVDGLVRAEGREDWVAARDVPELSALVNAPPTVAGQVSPPDAVDNVGSVIIPYKNAAALTGYYVSVGGLAAMLIPLLGIAVSTAAIVLGVKGIQAARRNPKVHGTAHGVVAIVLGTIELIVSLVIATVILVAMIG